MIILPFINMPDPFTQLLCLEVKSNSASQYDLEKALIGHKEINLLIKNLFRDIDPEGSLSKIFSLVGWTAIRNRLTSAYLEYATTGHFPEIANLTLITDLIMLENKLKKFTTPDHSRIFLLGLYSKLTLIRQKKINDPFSMTSFALKERHFDFLKSSKSVSYRIDWLMVHLFLFEQYLGSDRLNTLLISGSRLQSLFALLSDDEKIEMMENLLVYGSSIGDNEIFFKDFSNID